jgi:hypothetical protein
MKTIITNRRLNSFPRVDTCASHDVHDICFTIKYEKLGERDVEHAQNYFTILSFRWKTSPH